MGSPLPQSRCIAASRQVMGRDDDVSSILIASACNVKPVSW